MLLSACDDLMAPRTLGPLRDARRLRPLRPRWTRIAFAGAAGRARRRAADRARRRGRPLGRRRHARRARLRGAADRGARRRARAHVPRRRDRRAPSAAPLPRRARRLPGAPARAARRCRARPWRGWRPAPAPTRTRCTASPAATRSSSPRCSPRPATRAVERRSRRCSRASAGSGRDCREALDQLSVVPPHVSLDLAAELLGVRLDALAEAELAGVIEVRADSLAFRHELARRAVEQSLPALRRQQLNAAVVAALRAPSRDPSSRALMHHAVEARDIDTIIEVGPSAGARGGAGRLAPAGARALSSRSSRTRAGSGCASAPTCSTATAGSSTTRSASATPSRRAARPRSCIRSSATRSPRQLPRAAVAAPVHGRRDRRGGGARARGGGDPRADRRRRRARPRLALRRRRPRASPTSPSSRRRSSSARASWRCAPGGPTSPRCASTTSGSRGSRSGPGGLQLLRESIARGDGRTPVRVRRARLLQPVELLARGGRLDELEARVGRRACASRASAGSGRTPTTWRSTAASG